ncbi:hypothetical protein KCU77_g526, partial [Aureobasidium melanogenum]
MFRFPSSTSATPLVPRTSYDAGIEMRDYLGSQDPGSPHIPQSAPPRGQRLTTIARKILTGALAATRYGGLQDGIATLARDIGLLSTRNLRHINKKRFGLWLMLAASSVTLHLFYNAAVFKYAVAYDYDVEFINWRSEDYLKLNASSQASNLTNIQWMAAFGSDFVYDYTDLHIVFDAVGTATGLTGLSDPITISMNDSWPQLPAISPPDFNTQGWLLTSQGYHVHAVHAFAHPASGRNAVQFSLHFMIIVIVANLVKTVIMGSVVFKTGLVNGSSYLVICGDAVASFLARPDRNTKGLSTASKPIMLGMADYVEGNRGTRRLTAREVQGHGDTQQHCMGSAMTSHRMIWWCNAMVIALGFSAGFLIDISDITNTFAAWGTSSQTTFGQSEISTASILLNAWLTSIPQLVFSFTYLNLNGIFTSMALAKEWNMMAPQRKGLRVSHPEMAQRSTYFLQLPYKWAIPLTIAGGSLHWLVSQSIFLVQIDVLSATGERDTDMAFVASGFSSSSYFVLILVFGAIFLAAYVVAMLPLRENIPFGASCSAIISAACHPPDNDTEAHLKEVQWGVVDTTHPSGL